MGVAMIRWFVLARARLAVALAVVLAAMVSASSTAAQAAAAAPRSLAGMWIDSARVTPEDTLAWRLDPNGSDWVVRIRVVRDSANRATTERRDKRYGYWYLRGALDDTLHRTLCFKQRPRDGGTCYPFHMDTLPAPAGSDRPRRQITIAGYRGQREARIRVLIERLP